MSEVAVIGCGAFGAATALKLDAAGHKVTVFDRLPGPFRGASYNNQRRLHLGFHYPRDADTARQCIKGFDAYHAEFPACIERGFTSAYFIADEGSKTTAAEYIEFCDLLGLRYERLDLDAYRPRMRGVSLGVSTDEVVYDSVKLSDIFMARLGASRTRLRFGTEVVGARARGPRFELRLSNGDSPVFDAVVNATYAASSRITDSLDLPLVERQYEYTVVPVIKVPFGRTGITVMDGPFMTILPMCDGPLHLLYDVEHSVIARDVDVHMNSSWLDKERSPFAAIDPGALFERMRRAGTRFIPDLEAASAIDFLHGPRMVLAKRDDTDARPSLVEQPMANYISVFSGKIDHSAWVADEVAKLLRHLVS